MGKNHAKMQRRVITQNPALEEKTRMRELTAENKRLASRVRELSAEMDMAKAYNVQQCIDVAKIINHQRMNYGKDGNERWEKEFIETVKALFSMALREDADEQKVAKQTKRPTDKSVILAGTIGRLDALLAESCGGECIPYEKRYQPMALYELAVKLGIDADEAEFRKFQEAEEHEKTAGDGTEAEKLEGDPRN